MRQKQTLQLFALFSFPNILLSQTHITAVVNSATYSGDISFSSIVSVFGFNLATFTESASKIPLPLTLGGAQLMLCGLSGQGQTFKTCFPLPLIYASQSQINAVMPDGPIGILEKWSGTLQVSAGGLSSIVIGINPAAPGIFREAFDCAYPNACSLANIADAQHSSARGAILDQSGRLVSSLNPVLAHQAYSAFVTGLGIPNNTPAARQIVASFIGLTYAGNGVFADVSYLDSAPGFVGLYQINFQLPQDLRRAFGDGINLPVCSTLTTDLKAEMNFSITTSPGNTADSVKIPILVHPNELDCTR